VYYTVERGTVCVLQSVEGHCVGSAQCRELLCVYCTVLGNILCVPHSVDMYLCLLQSVEGHCVCTAQFKRHRVCSVQCRQLLCV